MAARLRNEHFSAEYLCSKVVRVRVRVKVRITVSLRDKIRVGLALEFWSVVGVAAKFFFH